MKMSNQIQISSQNTNIFQKWPGKSQRKQWSSPELITVSTYGINDLPVLYRFEKQIRMYNKLLGSSSIRSLLTSSYSGNDHLTCIQILRQLCNHPSFVVNKQQSFSVLISFLLLFTHLFFFIDSSVILCPSFRTPGPGLSRNSCRDARARRDLLFFQNLENDLFFFFGRIFQNDFKSYFAAVQNDFRNCFIKDSSWISWRILEDSKLNLLMLNGPLQDPLETPLGFFMIPRRSPRTNFTIFL